MPLEIDKNRKQKWWLSMGLLIFGFIAIYGTMFWTIQNSQNTYLIFSGVLSGILCWILAIIIYLIPTKKEKETKKLYEK